MELKTNMTNVQALLYLAFILWLASMTIPTAGGFFSSASSLMCSFEDFRMRFAMYIAWISKSTPFQKRGKIFQHTSIPPGTIIKNKFDYSRFLVLTIFDNETSSCLHKYLKPINFFFQRELGLKPKRRCIIAHLSACSRWRFGVGNATDWAQGPDGVTWARTGTPRLQ